MNTEWNTEWKTEWKFHTEWKNHIINTYVDACSYILLQKFAYYTYIQYIVEFSCILVHSNYTKVSFSYYCGTSSLFCCDMSYELVNLYFSLNKRANNTTLCC